MKSALFGLIAATIPIWATLIVVAYALCGLLLGFIEGAVRGAFEVVDLIDRYRPK